MCLFLKNKMSYELIITEKPQAAKRIAEALSDSKPIKKSVNKVPYYELTHNKKDIVIGCAVGHLYTVAEKDKGKWTYPVFNLEWIPSYEKTKQKYSRKYISLLKKLSKKAYSYTVACDYDIEGEVIGLNIIRYICKQKDANRMKFSTLTKGDLKKSYDIKSKHLDWGQANAGETRHFLDWMYGINLSRALTLAIKAAGRFKVLSSGRVQGPALKIIVDKEKEIKKFKPEKYWQLQLLGKVKQKLIEAFHKKDKFKEENDADEILKKTKGKDGKIKEIKKSKFSQKSPFPFDLTTLQTEAHRSMGISPKETLALAQRLYINGLISYPRTSSQKLPKEIGYKNILQKISRQKEYKGFCNELLKKYLMPKQGSKTDAAHPAIYPTGVIPKAIKPREKKVYDLVVRRFLAVFGEDAVRETIILSIDVNSEIFIAKGTRTIKQGWFKFYEKHVKIKEEELPEVEEGDEVKVKSINKLEKETQPPRRYTESSIIRELEKRNLGTKCLTSNNFVKINSNNQIHNENIAELFDSLYNNFPTKDENGMKIAINHKKTCFSFNELDEIKSNFKLVSKRKLRKKERIYRIKYKDGSFIETTEEHPFLIYDKGSCKYMPLKDLKKGMKSVTSVKFSEKLGDIICSWEDFLEKCNKKTKLYGISNEISTKRKKQNLSQHTFGKKYNITQSSICMYELSQNVPLYIIKKLNLSKPKNICSTNKNQVIENPFPLRMTSPLARILANLIGDCSIDSVKILKENCYDFRYHNTNIDLINRFNKDIKTVFGVDLNIKVAKPSPGHLPKYYVRLPAVIGRIISILFSEVIKKNAVKIHSEFYPEFIGSLFDDEGHSMKNEPKLFISNTNFKLLEDVKKMLSALDIKAILDKKQFKLYIRGRENIQKFLEKIPFASIEKKRKIINNLSKFYKFGRRLSSLQKQFLIISALNGSKNKKLTNREISEKLGFKMPKSMHHLNLLIKNGYVKKIVTGISEYPRKRITYKLIKSVDETFFKYIDEKVISSDFITKTIKSIKEIDYDGYVYDITNNLEIPNFILSNGVVVHNSTRAQIIDSLYQRGYVIGKSVEATKLGIKTIETLEKFCPEIIDEELTRHFEDEMEEIREKKKEEKEVLEEAKRELTTILENFKQKEKKIGEGLLESYNEEDELGKCPKCGGTLKVMYSRKTKSRFVACSNYPDCKATYKIPQKGTITKTGKICDKCKLPIIKILRGKRKQEICLNPDCPNKKVDKEEAKEIKEFQKNGVNRKCPKCGHDLVLRSSVYGKFIGCSNYPKCRYTEKINGNGK